MFLDTVIDLREAPSQIRAVYLLSPTELVREIQAEPLFHGPAEAQAKAVDRHRLIQCRTRLTEYTTSIRKHRPAGAIEKSQALASQPKGQCVGNVALTSTNR